MNGSLGTHPPTAPLHLPFSEHGMVRVVATARNFGVRPQLELRIQEGKGPQLTDLSLKGSKAMPLSMRLSMVQEGLRAFTRARPVIQALSEPCVEWHEAHTLALNTGELSSRELQVDLFRGQVLSASPWRMSTHICTARPWSTLSASAVGPSNGRAGLPTPTGAESVNRRNESKGLPQCVWQMQSCTGGVGGPGPG